MMKLEDLPNFNLLNTELIHEFSDDLKNSLESVTALRDFILRWQAVWELDRDSKEGRVKEIDDQISNLQVDQTTLECLKLIFNDHPCIHSCSNETCQGMQIRMPFTLTKAILIAHHFGVPVPVALTQLYHHDQQS